MKYLYMCVYKACRVTGAAQSSSGHSRREGFAHVYFWYAVKQICQVTSI